MNLLDLCASISLDTRDYESGLERASQKSSTFTDVLKASLTSEAIISGAKKLASVVTEIGKAAYQSYSEYEQLAGGAELLFGDAYNTVAKNAKNAYKTIQMSQNEYLAQVNGLATGLKTALNGNAEAAAELAHKVLTAEADIVAATGNTQEAVQNAFNGIMRGNYTMLDNLQLGITPTKEGFQELIDKVNEWNAENGRATKYTIDNVADAQSALVDYIEMQGLAGYAANEAADTIQGSTASMKAAWENLTAGMSDETADMEELTQNFVDSVGTAVKNILPKVRQILTGVGTATAEGISYLRETNEAIDLLITVIEDVAIAATIAGTAIAGDLAGKAIKNVATVFMANAEALAFFTVESGKAAVAEATLNGVFSVSEIVVGVLTGKISLATAAQYAWNTAIAANPIGAMVTLLVALGLSIKGTVDAGEKFRKTLYQTDKTAIDTARKLQAINAEIAELEEINHGEGLSRDEFSYLAALYTRAGELQAELASLTDAATAAKIASGELTAQSLADGEAILSAAETYSASVQDIISDYYSTYNSIYTGLYNASSLFTEVAEATRMTADDIRKNLDANTEFYESYADNLSYVIDAADAAGVNIDGLLQILEKMDTSDAAGAIAAIREELEATASTEEAVQTLEDWMAKISKYGEAVDAVSDPMALAVSDVEAKLKEAEGAFAAAVENLDKGAEAIEAGKATMEGLVGGITSGTPNVLSAVDSLAAQMQSKLKTSFDSFVLNITATVTSTDGSHKTGLDYVPFDGYIAELHRGEMVLTSREANEYRNGNRGGNGVTVIQNIHSEAKTAADLMAEAKYQQEMAVLLGV